MSNKIDKLLKVLDLPERELDKNRGIHQPQYEWLYAHAHEYGFTMKIPHPDCTFAGVKTQEFLADLAFRLRDEAIETCLAYGKDFETVAIALQNYIVSPPPNPQLGKSFRDYLIKVRACSMWVNDSMRWWAKRAQPIHWIISSLIAKELAKENTDVKDR